MACRPHSDSLLARERVFEVGLTSSGLKLELKFRLGSLDENDVVRSVLNAWSMVKIEILKLFIVCVHLMVVRVINHFAVKLLLAF